MPNNEFITSLLETLKKDQKSDNEQLEKYKNLSKELNKRIVDRGQLINMIEVQKDRYELAP